MSNVQPDLIKREKRRAKFLEALVSGKYKQATGTLFQRMAGEIWFCANGLAYQLLIDEELEGMSWLQRIFTHRKYNWENTTQEIYDAITKAYGYDIHTLIHLNDKRGYSFSAIANYLRKHNGTLPAMPYQTLMTYQVINTKFVVGCGGSGGSGYANGSVLEKPVCKQKELVLT